jgi:hypothetical protein
MKWFLFLLVIAISAPAQTPTPQSLAQSDVPRVPRPAPEFVWSSISGKLRRLRDVRGQAAVLIFAGQPVQKDFRAQLKQIAKRYRQLSARNVLFFVAFTKESGLIRSNIPFIVLPDPLTVADAYRVGDFGIAIIGPDGNLDYATDEVISGQRIVDVVNNSFVPQLQSRRGQ